MIIYPMYANEDIIDDFYFQIVSGEIKAASKTCESKGKQSMKKGGVNLPLLSGSLSENKDVNASETTELVHKVTTSMKIKEIIGRAKDFDKNGVRLGSIFKIEIAFRLNSCKTGMELINSSIGIIGPFLGSNDDSRMMVDSFKALESEMPNDELLFETDNYAIIARFDKKWLKSQEIDDIVSKEMHAILFVKNIEREKSERFKTSNISKMLGMSKLEELQIKTEENVDRLENERKMIIESDIIYDTELIALYYTSEL